MGGREDSREVGGLPILLILRPAAAAAAAAAGGLLLQLGESGAADLAGVSYSCLFMKLDPARNGSWRVAIG